MTDDFDFDSFPMPRMGLARIVRKLREPETKRVRKPSFREVERQAGRPVVAYTIAPDGSRTYAFGASASDADLNEWDRDLGTNTPSLRQ
jgi:hypothetical protein